MLAGGADEVAEKLSGEDLVDDAAARVIVMRLGGALAEMNVKKVEGCDEELVGILLFVTREMAGKSPEIDKSKNLKNDFASHLAFFQMRKRRL